MLKLAARARGGKLLEALLAALERVGPQTIGAPASALFRSLKYREALPPQSDPSDRRFGDWSIITTLRSDFAAVPPRGEDGAA